MAWSAYGEVCPLGPFYLAGLRRGRARRHQGTGSPHLLGCDPTQLDVLNRRMDAALKGHPYVKAGIDMACWDILGQVAGQPVCNLLGGRYGEDFVLYRAISQGSPDEMAEKVAGYREEGYRRFQLKVGADPQEDIERIRFVGDICWSRATSSSPMPTLAGSCTKRREWCERLAMSMYILSSPA